MLDFFNLVNPTGLFEMFSDLKSKFKAVIELEEKLPEIEAEAKENDEQDGTGQFLNSFMKKASSDLQETEKKLNNIEEKFSELIQFYAEETKDYKIENFFQLWIKLAHDLNVCFFLKFRMLRVCMRDRKKFKKKN